MRYKAKSTMVGWYREPSPLLEEIQQGRFLIPEYFWIQYTTVPIMQVNNEEEVKMKKGKFMKMVLTACMASIMVVSAGCGKKEAKDAGSAGKGGKIEYKLAYHLPADHPLAKSVDSFIQKVKEKTNGEVSITAYPAGQLYNDKSMNDAIMTGGVDMGLNTVGRWATVVPAMEVFDVPFVFPDYAKIDRAIDGGMGKILADELEKKHVKVVYWADYGFVQFANNKKPIKTPKDFEGLKMRGYSELSSETIKALGASPVTMGSGEVYMALQRGTIDGQSSGTSAMRDRKIYEVAKYLTITNHASPEFILAMNDRSFKKMNANQQKAFMEAANEVRDEIRKNAKAMDEQGLNDLKAKGMEVYVVPEAELQAWRDATKSVWDTFLKHTGDIGKKVLDMAANA
jgi:tripartite ATP-independent transporter DctP family solute receptor